MDPLAPELAIPALQKEFWASQPRANEDSVFDRLIDGPKTPVKKAGNFLSEFNRIVKDLVPKQLNRAKDMAASGKYTGQEIFNQTGSKELSGFWPDIEGKLRTGFYPEPSYFKKGGIEELMRAARMGDKYKGSQMHALHSSALPPMKYGDLIDSPSLNRYAPDINNVPLRIVPKEKLGMTGGYHPISNEFMLTPESLNPGSVARLKHDIPDLLAKDEVPLGQIMKNHEPQHFLDAWQGTLYMPPGGMKGIDNQEDYYRMFVEQMARAAQRVPRQYNKEQFMRTYPPHAYDDLGKQRLFDRSWLDSTSGQPVIPGIGHLEAP